MITKILWILLSLTMVVKAEQPLIVSSATELSDKPPENRQEWLHPVIFEPQNKIQLTRSTYQVTTFLDFTPFVNGFNNLQNYIKDFKKDIHNPEYFSLIMYMNTNPSASPLLNEQDLATFMQSAYCLSAPYACMTRLKIDSFLMEVNYLEDLFDVVFQKFLNAIDHIDYHPTMQNAPASNRSKRSVSFSKTGFYATYDRTLNPTEEIFLDKLLITLENMNSTLVDKFKRMKRYSILTWVLGWGIFSNSRSINKIKKNLRILQDQNLLQDKQIKALAGHLNLTMAHVNQHENMLYELDTKLMVLNKTLQSIMVQLSYFRYESNLIDHMQLCINRIYTAVYALKEDIDALYEYMRVLTTQQLNPLIIPPDILRYVLEQVKDDIRSNAWLMLSEDPTQNIWTYYNIIKVTPIVMDDYLMVILTIPLIDSSLDVNLYKVYNLPMLHPKLQIQVEYQLEGTYFATHMHGMYATIPKESDIKLCMMSQGHLCMFDEPLYPVDEIEWCLYALFMNDLSKIDLNCKVIATTRHTNLAHSLDGYLWAVSSLATEKLQIRCLHHTSVVTIDLPLRIIDVGNGCEVFSPTLYIPAKLELTATMQYLTPSQFFLQYNSQYVKMSSFVIFHEMSFEHLTPDELTDLRSKVQTLEPMNMQLFNAKLCLIDEKYPLTIPPWVTLGGQIISGAFILTEITLYVLVLFKTQKKCKYFIKTCSPFCSKIKR